MDAPAVTIRLHGNCHHYHRGQTLSGEYLLEGILESQLKAIEVSVLWYTEGKGDEDMAVHEFWRLDKEAGDPIDLSSPACFTTVLPASPLSYDGVIVSICWCVRVRVFLQHGKEVFGQKMFRLGDVPPAEVRPS